MSRGRMRRVLAQDESPSRPDGSAILAWLAVEVLILVVLGERGGDRLLALLAFGACVPLGFALGRWRAVAIPLAAGVLAVLIASLFAGCGDRACQSEDTLIGNLLLTVALLSPAVVTTALGVLGRKLLSRLGPAGPRIPPASATSPG